MRLDPSIDARAIDWMIRQRDPAFADWEPFADWLGQSPAHADAFHAAVALDDDLAALPARPAPAHADVPEAAPRRAGIGRRVWLGGAIAASLALLVTVPFLMGSDRYTIETAPGAPRTVALADGSSVAINGGSRVELDRDDIRFARIEQGQALFSVVHDETAPFRVEVGEATLVDVGTVFDVTRSGETTTLAVSEGAVIYNPDAENVRVDPGERLVAIDSRADVVLGPIAASSVGGWQRGQLVYDGAPLADVAADVARVTGVRIRVSSRAGLRVFRGALLVRQDEARLVADIAALSGTRATRQGEEWVLSE